MTSLRIRNLTLPLPGTPRSELMEEERLSRAILHLLAVYALRLTSHDRRRHAAASVLYAKADWIARQPRHHRAAGACDHAHAGVDADAHAAGDRRARRRSPFVVKTMRSTSRR